MLIYEENNNNNKTVPSGIHIWVAPRDLAGQSINVTIEQQTYTHVCTCNSSKNEHYGIILYPQSYQAKYSIAYNNSLACTI